jgi:glycosyltransferase involved in cell wall biosynthesis
LRVLMISKACVVGMYQRKLEELARIPDTDLHVVVPPFWRDGRHVTPLERAYPAGYELDIQPMALNGSFHLHFYPKLGGVFQHLRPDILHMDEEPYNLATFQAMRLASRHGTRSLFFTWQNLLRRYPPPFSAFERYSFRHASFALAGNQEAVQVLRAKGYTGPVEVVPQFGVDPELYHKDLHAPRAATGFVIGYAGRLVEEKGVQVLLHAVAELRGDWSLRVLGRGPYQRELEALGTRLGLGERVEYCTGLSYGDMPRELNALDVLVLPSLTRRNWKEQFGRVLIEAMACEVPVVGSSSGEIPHLIGEAGMVFPEGDARSLREALGRLMQSHELCAELGQRGRARVLGHYTQRHIAAATHAIYRRMLAGT